MAGFAIHKDSSLDRLTRLNQPEPSGFIVTSEAYRLWVNANGLSQVITDSLIGISPDDQERWSR